MIYAPVIIPTLCRYEHFKRCIESLSRCTGAEHTEVYIGLDYPAKESHWYGYNKIKEYLEHCGNLGFKELHVVKRPHNLGSNGNYVLLREYVFEKYDRLILSEDDNEFSPCFLDYMNKGLELYKDNSRVFCIGAYSTPEYEQRAENNVFFSFGVTAWGIGCWKEKDNEFHNLNDDYFLKVLSFGKAYYKVLSKCPLGISAISEMFLKKTSWGDWKRSIYCILENKYQLRPALSLVRNWGHDGSGEHCGINNSFTARNISTDTHFIYNQTEVKEDSYVAQYMKHELFSNNIIKCVLQVLKIIVYPCAYHACRKIYKNDRK